MMYNKCAVAFTEENEVTNISNPDLITIDHIMYIFQIIILCTSFKYTLVPIIVQNYTSDAGKDSCNVSNSHVYA